MFKYIRKWLAPYFQSPRVGDLDFKAKFKEAIHKEINRFDLENKLSKNITTLIQIRGGAAVADTTKARERFFEFFSRLLLRYTEVRVTEWEMYYWDRLADKRPMKDIQLELVNHTESFHQQIYAAISSFVKLLSHIAPISFTQRLPIRRISDFLNFVGREFPSLSGEVEILRSSTKTYRSTYVDHTSQNPIHDWWTFSGPDGKAHIVYFMQGTDARIHEIPELTYGELIMRTPFAVSSYFVPPHPQVSLFAFIKIVDEILTNLVPNQSPH